MSDLVKTVNPYTEETIREYSLLSEKEASACIESAHECFESWKLASVKERAALLTTGKPAFLQSASLLPKKITMPLETHLLKQWAILKWAIQTINQLIWAQWQEKT